MLTGRIQRLERYRGLGIIKSTEGKKLLFYRRQLQGAVFDSLREGQNVEFEFSQSPKGLRAVKIKLVEERR
ncbi:MAG: cold shock domain-containing protein [Candidatus Bathyarchaeota archaeon]|nr:cold shock domain-containing protein [Candidatus Bathyarchaeota archaeon]